ncbi:transient receptor potential cation channel subfamily A member 1-like isoform X4 [Biomphalaria glabrata]|uniref:Transient receptor potential cation channel subfamily A member 1-like isoform X4 n=1 Tax=Biomphalaria glabrata TaxID=6526 RepID=A0A9U8EA28_BIOGL|nr:transient receptor potential cation channel subfamily A member 1-like isoform X4 [Biomphalaria glabrata]
MDHGEIFEWAADGMTENLKSLFEENPNFITLTGRNGSHLIHVAVQNNQEDVIKLIVKSLYGAREIDALDINGNTPLHVAVTAGDARLTKLLIDLNAATDIKNGSGLMAIHLAAELKDVTVLKVLLRTGINPNMQGDTGYTPLHVAAAKNNFKALELLIKHGGNLTIRALSGFSPVHTAAINGATEAIQIFVEEGKLVGYSKEQIMNLMDSEKQLPIHAAVTSGNARTVEMCLKYGAICTSQKNDGSTPVHYAAAQGNVNVLQAIFDHEKRSMYYAQTVTDIQGRTPLHWAALFNHVEVVKYLLKLHAEIDWYDKAGNTPLLTAASSGAWGAVNVLLSSGADVMATDGSNRNFLHIAIRSELDLKGFFKNLEQSKSKILLIINEQDIYGSTSLHYAAQEGYVQVVESLLALSASPLIKDKNHQSALHVAASNGRYSVCKILLNSSEGAVIKNETDVNGMSALHLSAQNGYFKILSMFIQHGTLVTRNLRENTPLHLAAENGHETCVYNLMTVHSYLLDAVNIDGNTALHLAALNDHPDVVKMLLSAGAANLYNVDEYSFFDYVISKGHQSVAYTVINHDRWEECLECHSKLYGKAMLGLIQHLPSVFLHVLDRCISRSKLDPMNENYNVTYNFRYLFVEKDVMSYAQEMKMKFSHLLPLKCGILGKIELWTVVVYCSMIAVKELIRFIKSIKSQYFLDFQNYLNWSTYWSSLFFCFPFLLGYSTHIQWDFGAVSILLAWFNCMVNLQRFNLVGIYIVMFLAIMKTLLQVILIFFMIVTAFGLAFYVLMSEEPSQRHKTPLLSIYSTFILIFEIEYLLTFNTVYLDNDPSTLHFSTLSFLLLAIFLFCMPLLLVNLLIGLAVGDIASVQRDAKQKKLATQVMFHDSVEEALPFLSKVPNMYTIYPNLAGFSCTESMHFKQAKFSDSQTEVEETFIGKEISKVQTRLDELFDVCEKNKGMMQEIMKQMGITPEDDLRDEKEALIFG